MYVILWLLYTVLLFLFNELIVSKDVFRASYGERLDDSLLSDLYRKYEQLEWLQYLVYPFVLLLKALATTAALYLHRFFQKNGASFGRLLQMVLWAEFVFVLADISRYLGLLFEDDLITLEYLQWFSPFSLLALFEPGSIALWYVYPLKSCNLFELLYMIVLGFLWHKNFGESFWRSLEIVIRTYGMAFFLWVVFVSFLSLNLV